MFLERCRALNDSKHQLLCSADGAFSRAKGKAYFPSKQKLSDSSGPGCSGGTRWLLLCSGLISRMTCGEPPFAGRFQPPGAQGGEKKKESSSAAVRAVTGRGSSPVVKCCCCVCLEGVIFVLVSLKAAGSLFGFPEALSHQLLSSCSIKGKVTKGASPPQNRQPYTPQKMPAKLSPCLVFLCITH